MIEHVDIALRDWLSEVLDVAAVEFGRSDREGDASAGRRKRSGPVMYLRLVGVTEQIDRRSNAIADLRDDDGRVLGRRGAARVFHLDYVCDVDGDPIDAHAVLGRMLQLLIGNDTIPIAFVPAEIVPAELTMRDVPIEIDLAPPDAEATNSARGSGVEAGVAIRATVPIWPEVDTQIGEPAVHLHLDVGPEPGSGDRSPRADGAADEAADDQARRDSAPVDPIDRKWTTVRRREFIAPGSVAPKG